MRSVTARLMRSPPEGAVGFRRWYARPGRDAADRSYQDPASGPEPPAGRAPARPAASGDESRLHVGGDLGGRWQLRPPDHAPTAVAGGAASEQQQVGAALVVDGAFE